MFSAVLHAPGETRARSSRPSSSFVVCSRGRHRRCNPSSIPGRYKPTAKTSKTPPGAYFVTGALCSVRPITALVDEDSREETMSASGHPR